MYIVNTLFFVITLSLYGQLNREYVDTVRDNYDTDVTCINVTLPSRIILYRLSKHKTKHGGNNIP